MSKHLNNLKGSDKCYCNDCYNLRLTKIVAVRTVAKSITLKNTHRIHDAKVSLDKHQWSFIDGVADTKVTGIKCIACYNLIQAVTSVYSRVTTNVLKRVIDTLKVIDGNLTEVRTVINFPVFETGYACQTCFDKLYSIKYIDNKGNIHRGIEQLHAPVNTVKEKTSKGVHVVPATRAIVTTRDDNYARGREGTPRYTAVILDHGEIVEEWKTLPLAKPDPEPIDAKAYHYFRRGAR